MLKLLSKNLLLEIEEETQGEYAGGILRPEMSLGIKDTLKLIAKSEDCKEGIPIGAQVFLEMSKDDIRHYALDLMGKRCLIAKESYAIGYIEEKTMLEVV